MNLIAGIIVFTILFFSLIEFLNYVERQEAKKIREKKPNKKLYPVKGFKKGK